MDIWNWRFAIDILPSLIRATGATVMAAVGGYIIATVIGLAFALILRSRIRVLTFFVRELVEFLRSTPLILQIFFVFYVGPEIGVRLSPWASGMIALAGC
ncbi:ABC transporter permease subunit [Paraburkholderia sp. EG285A]|uniref:ABC transporter permease subunit n=1 Tax=Paraburkholderia sp. EG285A TaxID=3237009 RepID=UPI0034D1CE43